jgi:hypothetical protein
MKRQKELKAVAGELQAQRNLMVRHASMWYLSMLICLLQGKGKKMKVGSAATGSKQYKWKQERKK